MHLTTHWTNSLPSLQAHSQIILLSLKYYSFSLPCCSSRCTQESSHWYFNWTSFIYHLVPQDWQSIFNNLSITFVSRWHLCSVLNVIITEICALSFEKIYAQGIVIIGLLSPRSQFRWHPHSSKDCMGQWTIHCISGIFDSSHCCIVSSKFSPRTVSIPGSPASLQAICNHCVIPSLW